MNAVLMGLQLRIDHLFRVVQCIVGVGLRKVFEHLHHPRQQLARPLHRDDRVVEAGRRRITGDAIDLCLMVTQRRLDRRQVIRIVNLVEGRGVVWQGVRRQQRVVSGGRAARLNADAEQERCRGKQFDALHMVGLR